MRIRFLLLIPVVIFLSACSGSDSGNKEKDSYESGKLSIEEIEKKNPIRFLKVEGSDKRNLLGQTVIKGTIESTAKIAVYKDVDIKLSFYSKTGVLLEENHELVYETVAPGKTVSFKSKYFAAKGTDSIAMKVVSAGIVKE